ncbi:hypothetical protein Golob_003922, partial [Gossypium lobatum]|nr:hypothetical protein [Gossypium lobatum]
MHQRISYMSFETAHWLKKFGNRSTQIPMVGKLAGHASLDYWLGAYGRITYLNTDGVVRVDSGVAAAGEVLSDKNGEWILGYNKYLGNCSILDAKLWGILDSLKHIQRRGDAK